MEIKEECLAYLGQYYKELFLEQPINDTAP